MDVQPHIIIELLVYTLVSHTHSMMYNPIISVHTEI